ncbi:GGDEF domain-containing protein [Sulfurimonas sp. SAG-AH-194-C21]|nr:sensor domain-containing diguanylate cyclase [Sulfurimonas sp. SAG-AH-194-C21]MDF1883932.1 GGDEF domain-containing protein [Sulfurimonas sp. SAG-AH-194-C21]
MVEHDYIHDSVITGELLLFRTLWNDSDDNMFIVSLDNNGDFISESSNKSLEKTFGLRENQLDGQKLKDLLDEETFTTITNRYKECLQRNRPISYDESAILDGIHERFWSTTILPVIDKKSNICKIFGISREFTKIITIQNELNLLNATLEKKVQERTKDLKIALHEMKELSITDKLTGLYNRLKLDEVLSSKIKLFERYDEAFGLIIIDIDLFKSVNDTYGHIVGDKVLLEFSTLLKNSVRETDVLGRWGGEEFLVICPKSNLQGTKVLSESLRIKIASYEFSDIGKLTASFGVTEFKNDDTLQSIINRSDIALYQAKNSGRNCVESIA